MKSRRFKIVPCSEEYWEFVRQLRTDKRVAAGFITKAKITSAQQKSYMKKHARHFLICLVDKEPAGYFGVIDNDIRICTHPDYQKLGVGKFMVRKLKSKYPKALAKVKVTNKPSQKLFAQCGYKPAFITYTLK